MRQDSIRTRVVSPRQLPTDHDYAVSTREYQSDQPSLPPLSVTGSDAATKKFGLPHSRKAKLIKKRLIDRSLHIRRHTSTQIELSSGRVKHLAGPTWCC